MSQATAIELKHITKSFGSVIANNDICMNVNKGEILSILGENGSGKTTLMNMISGIYFPDEGQIFIDGEVLQEDYGKDPIDSAGIAAEKIILGEEEYFVLGDNRRVSIDSRAKLVGAVKLEEMDGVVFLRVAPFSAFGGVN